MKLHGELAVRLANLAFVNTRRKPQKRVGLIQRYTLGARLLHLAAPRIKHAAQQRNGLCDGPVRKACLVAEISKVVVVTPQLRLKLLVLDGGQRAVG